MASLAWRKRTAVEQLGDLAGGDDRFVDFGVNLVVVRADPDGEELLPGAPRLSIVRTHRRGGMVDTLGGEPRFCGPSEQPVTWYCSEDAEPLVLHGDGLADRLLVYGSEGASKTTSLTSWTGLRALEFTGEPREIGLTAPTNPRLELVWQAITRWWPAHWYRWVERDSCFYLRNGVSVRLVSTHKQSEAGGSRVQGYNWSAVASDEIQDSLEADADIEMRLRSAPGGRGRRFATATAKDSSDFRTWRDRVLSSGLWQKHVLLGPRSPFIAPRVWEERKQTLTEREYLRRILAQDVGPERQIYFAWNRAENLIPVPDLGVEDVTARELAMWGPNFRLLVGHDPGKRQHVSLFLKAYQFPRESHPRWFVVDEVTTPEATVETHVAAVLSRARDAWHCNLLDRKGLPVEYGSQILVRADPYSDSGEEQPDRSVYTIWRNRRVVIMPAAYKPGATTPGRVKKEAGIDLINTLLCNANGQRRLFVACDERRQPAAPRLVDALEMSERDEANRAETERKDSRDKSHWPAALRYALWAVERPRLQLMGAR